MVSQKSKANLFKKAVIPCKILKQSTRNNSSKSFVRFRISGGEKLQK